MQLILYITGSLLLAGWIASVCLPFYVMYKLAKELAELNDEVEKEGD